MSVSVGRMRFRHQVLILLGSIIVVVMASVIAVGTPQLLESERRTAFERLRSVASLKALWVLRELHEIEAGVEALARDERLIDETRFLHQMLPYVESHSPLFKQIAAYDYGLDPFAGDKLSLYWQSHDRMMPSFSYLSNSYDGAELYIVRPSDALVTFSLNRNNVLMKRLDQQLDAKSPLYECYRRALANPNRVVFEDFDSSQGKSAKACAAAVMVLDKKILAVVIEEFPVNQFNAIMTMNTGLGETGESYLVGTDKRLRTDSRHMGNGSLLQTFVDSRPVREGLAGFSGEAEVKDYRGRDVSAVWQVITVDNIHWSLVVKMDHDEIYKHLRRNVASLSAVWFVLFVLLVMVAIAFANRIERPLRALLRYAQKMAYGNYSGMKRRSEGARELIELFDMFNLMAAQIHERTDALDKSRRKAELASKEAERATLAKSEFLSRMSHELRTPLNGVLGYAQILRRDASLGLSQRDTLVAIENCGQHLLELINDVLDLSRIEAGSLEVDLQDIQLQPLIRRVVDVVKPKADEKGLTFDVLLPDQNVTVQVDPTKFRQILINLLGNALKFTSKGSVELSVRLDEIQHLIVCDVKDTGPGIDAEHVEKIFQPFGQTITGKDAGGAGLGLSISKQLCDAMHGELSVDSTLGAGSTFTLRLPLQLVGQSVDTWSEPLGSATQPLLKPGTALVVDDSDVNRDLLGQLLTSFGFDCYYAEDGAQAVDVWCEQQCPLVLMDIQMPIMDGLEATAAIRSKQSKTAPVILAVSANAQRESIELALDTGCDEFFTKPIDVDAITQCLQQYYALNLQDMNDTGDASDGVKSEAAMELSIIYHDIIALKETAETGDFATVSTQIIEIGTKIGETHPDYLQLSQWANQFLLADIVSYCEQYLRINKG